MSRVNLNIPVSDFNNALSWDSDMIDRLVDYSIEAASIIGIRLDDDHEGKYLKEAEQKGARVDWNNRAVKFNRTEIIGTIEEMQKTMPFSSISNTRIECGKRDLSFVVGNGANMVFDWENWCTKDPGISDLIFLCNWISGCENIEGLFPPFMLKNVDQYIEPLLNYAVIAKYCTKRFYHEQPTHPIHVRYLGKMARVVEKYTGFYHPIQEWEYVNPPFRLGLRGIETMMARIDMGECNSMGIGAMSVSGMTSPITVTGAAVTIVAEIFSALTLLRILRPGIGLKCVICSGNLDLRTGRVSYFNMRSFLQNLAAWEMVRRGLKVDCDCLSWYRDSNEPGMQALYEFGMAQTFFTSISRYSYPEIGGLACGSIFSPEQAILDIEIVKEFAELVYGFEYDSKNIGFDEILNAGFEQSYHLMSEHTIEYMRDNVPFSNFLMRGFPSGANHDKNFSQTQQLMENSHKSVLSAAMKGKETAPDVELSNILLEYVREAAKELKIECPEITGI